MGYYPDELSFDPGLCRGQFLLTARDRLVPPGWVTRTHGRWTLAYSRPLACTDVQDAGGRPVAWILGHAVDSDGTLLRESEPARCALADEADFRRWVDALTGRFIAIHLGGSSPRLYQDVYGMLAAVFAPSEECVASTGLAIPVSPDTPFVPEWMQATDIPYRKAMYPLGLTPRRGVRRLLPNHVLDLSTWRLERVWPRATFRQDADPAQVTPRVAEVVRKTMAGVRDVFPLQIPLTAGLDSRLLLACARQLLDGTVFFTADLGDEGGWQDIVAAKAMARRFGLTHRLYPRRRARRRDLRTWAMRTGAETGEIRGWRACRTLSMQEANRASMTGFVGELARAYWWRRFTPATVVTPELIIGRCDALRPVPEFLRRAEEWLAGLPALNAVATIEMLYLEQRGACWAGVVEYGELGASALRLPPLCRADLVRDLIRLPDEYRRQDRVHLDLIASAWPELLEFPFNDAFTLPPSRRRLYRVHATVGRSAEFLGSKLRKARRQPGWILERLGLRAPPGAGEGRRP
jgi:hypothetical protein